MYLVELKKKEEKKNSGQRYFFLDSFRGFALLQMMAYHLLYDLFVLSGKNTQWIYKPVAIVWERFICCSFILTAGFCIRFSHHMVKRGVMLNLLGLVITIITLLVTPDTPIIFGILNLMGCSLLLMLPFLKTIRKDNWFIWAAAGICLFFITNPVYKGYLGLGNHILFSLPDQWYQSNWLLPFGIYSETFFSSDYFPLLPWFFLFLTGYSLSFLIDVFPASKQLLKKQIPFFTFLGQHSLLLYLLHQPVLLGLSMLLQKFI